MWTRHGLIPLNGEIRVSDSHWYHSMVIYVSQTAIDTTQWWDIYVSQTAIDTTQWWDTCLRRPLIPLNCEIHVSDSHWYHSIVRYMSQTAIEMEAKEYNRNTKTYINYFVFCIYITTHHHYPLWPKLTEMRWYEMFPLAQMPLFCCSGGYHMVVICLGVAVLTCLHMTGVCPML